MRRDPRGHSTPSDPVQNAYAPPGTETPAAKTAPEVGGRIQMLGAFALIVAAEAMGIAIAGVSLGSGIRALSELALMYLTWIGRPWARIALGLVWGGGAAAGGYLMLPYSPLTSLGCLIFGVGVGAVLLFSRSVCAYAEKEKWVARLGGERPGP